MSAKIETTVTGCGAASRVALALAVATPALVVRLAGVELAPRRGSARLRGGRAGLIRYINAAAYTVLAIALLVKQRRQLPALFKAI